MHLLPAYKVEHTVLKVMRRYNVKYITNLAFEDLEITKRNKIQTQIAMACDTVK
jgi:hypothetical protein